jgi:hypothetical protein
MIGDGEGNVQPVLFDTNSAPAPDRRNMPLVPTRTFEYTPGSESKTTSETVVMGRKKRDTSHEARGIELQSMRGVVEAGKRRRATGDGPM